MSEKLKELRELLGMSQETFSKILKIKRATYAQYESNYRRVPSQLADFINKLYDDEMMERMKKMKHDFLVRKLLKGDEKNE